MLEPEPSTETYLPVTLKSALPVFWITPPALTPTVPVVDPVPAVTPPEPPVKVAPVPLTVTLPPAVTVLESSAPFTVMFWPAEVVPVVAAVLGVKPVVLPAIVIFPLGASSKPLTKTVLASTAKMPSVARLTMPPLNTLTVPTALDAVNCMAPVPFWMTLPKPPTVNADVLP